MTENFIKNVVAAMQDSLTDEQLQKLENVLAINLHGLEVKMCIRDRDNTWMDITVKYRPRFM